jgi:hypothetical protein
VVVWLRAAKITVSFHPCARDEPVAFQTSSWGSYQILDIGSVAKCPQLRRYSRVKVMVNIADVQDMTMCRAPG